MNILIVGNGFDLEHQLPTKYWDFLMFIKNFKDLDRINKEERKKTPIFQILNEKIKEFLLSDEVFNSNNRSEKLNELSRLIKDNIWIDYFDKKTDYEHKGWIDFESEISYIIKCLDYLLRYNKLKLKNPNEDKYPDDSEKFDIAHKFLSDMKNKNITDHNNKFRYNTFYDDVAKGIIEQLFQDLNKLIRCLEIYLEECVEKIDIEYSAPDITNIEKINKVLSFNYTNTYQRKYYSNDNEIEYDYIHGKLDISNNIEENNMVLGIDEYLSQDQKNTELEFIQFKKYFQRIYKKTGCQYKRWVDEIKLKSTNSHKIFIFGHSLDITDKDVLKELIMSENTTTKIFYYDKKTYSQYIANLVKIIGQDELIDRVYGANPTIIFEPQSKRVKDK